MKWISASDKLPGLNFDICLKICDKPGFGRFYKHGDEICLGFEATNGFGTLFPYQFKDVKWLDEHCDSINQMLSRTLNHEGSDTTEAE